MDTCEPPPRKSFRASSALDKQRLSARGGIRAVALGVALSMATIAVAPTSLAQGTAKPAAKPAGKPDPKKAAEEQKKAEEAKAAEEKAAEEQKAADEAKAADEKKAAEAKAAAAPTVEPPHEVWDSKDVEETPGKSYLFVGARYRGNVIPQFLLNAFVDRGATIYSNTIGLEFDKRKDGFSLIPALSYSEYGTGDILFKEKNSKDIPGNYTFVNSGLKAFYATVDLLWSTKISKNVDFEYGAGLGIGLIFGDLKNNWVFRDQNGKLDGFSRCEVEGVPGSGCNKADHQNAETAKVGDYTEKSWFEGGSRPSIFPWISLPQVGLRIKPIKQFEGRVGLGFALTGFWFGLSGGYGLEQKPKP